MAKRTRREILAEPPPAPPAVNALPAEMVERTYTIQLVTPMFGGGVVAGHPDDRFPVRPTAIRGHLRFWWRVTCGHRYPLTAACRPGQVDRRQREEEIWGSTETPSAVQVEIAADRLSEVGFRWRAEPGCDPRQTEFGFRKYGALSYALFPARPEPGEQTGRRRIDRIVRESLSFRLKLTFPTESRLTEIRQREIGRLGKQGVKADQLPLGRVADISAEVDAALNAWLTFGGLGARTRRGLGAIRAQPSANITVPVGAVLLITETGFDDPLEALWQALDIYQWFRQKQYRNDGRRGERMGRSRWPEPDSLRAITGCHAFFAEGGTTVDHRQATVPAGTGLPCFPKAVLGLPIVFKFVDGLTKAEEYDMEKDPPRGTLSAHIADHPRTGEPVGDRMASPVIIRPIWSTESGKFVPGFLFLPAHRALALRAYLSFERALPGQTGSTLVPNDQITGHRVARFEPTHRSMNAIEALKQYVRNAYQSQMLGVLELRG